MRNLILMEEMDTHKIFQVIIRCISFTLLVYYKLICIFLFSFKLGNPMGMGMFPPPVNTHFYFTYFYFFYSFLIKIFYSYFIRKWEVLWDHLHFSCQILICHQLVQWVSTH